MKKLLTIFAVVLLAAITMNAQTATVTFNVDMSIQQAAGNFDPATDTVSVNGTFNNWTPAQDIMTDDDEDGVYTVAVPDITVGDTLYFKFWFKHGSTENWENDPNRELAITGDTSVTYFFNDVSELLQDLAITFQCNMEYEIVSGRFNPETDTLTVRGGMNGWGATDIMNPSALDPNLYEITQTYQVAADAPVGYKFAYMTADGVTGWEGGSDRTFTPTQTDIDAGFLVVSRTFNDATAADLTGQETIITFTVDMNGAVDGNNGTPFPQIDNVILAGAMSPLNWPSGGWPDSDEYLVIFLNDDGTDGDETAGDNIWSVDVTFPKYSLLNVEYKYGANFGTENNGGSNDNEGGVGDNHWIKLTPDMVSAKVENVFGVMASQDNPHPLVDIVTGIKQEDDSVPLTYSLDQNYPNPFNPSTTIKFAIPQQSNVTLKIYNMLGQEVATLVNEQMTAGNYTVNFDASNLSSGIYLYSIKAGQFNVTKKMMLIK